MFDHAVLKHQQKQINLLRISEINHDAIANLSKDNTFLNMQLLFLFPTVKISISRQVKGVACDIGSLQVFNWPSGLLEVFIVETGR